MNLYSRRKFLASLALLANVLGIFSLTAVSLYAQRRAPHKLRATAVLEVTTDPAGIVTTRVIPVTVLEEGRFRDATTYKASPRPMALENGIVYEAQKAGVATGYVTILNSANNRGWTALGKWQPATAAKKAESTPTPVTVADERPILHRGGSAPPSGSPASPPAPSGDASEAQPVSTPAPEDSDRPVLKRRAPANPESQAAPAPPKPAPTSDGKVPPVKLPVIAAGTRTFVGVSDNESTEPRSFEFSWKPGEEQQMQARMIRLALAQFPQENAQLTPNSLKNVVMRSFDLDMSNDAVIVLSAEIPGSYLTPAARETPGKFVSRYVTVIARVNFEGVPTKLASSVTDSTRLDVAPRLELIDAVDVDGDGLAELLFREYSFDQKSFIVYGVGRNSVTKVFEGAGSPLR